MKTKTDLLNELVSDWRKYPYGADCRDCSDELSAILALPDDTVSVPSEAMIEKVASALLPILTVGNVTTRHNETIITLNNPKKFSEHLAKVAIAAHLESLK